MGHNFERSACFLSRHKMLVYKDLFSGDEMFTDSHCPKLVDEILYEVDAKRVKVSNSIDDRLIGGNPSAEEQEEGAADGEEMVIDLVHASRLVSVPFTKESFKSHMKDLSKKIVEKLNESNPERVEVFKKKMPAALMKIIKSFDDYDFYTGESMNPCGSLAMMNFFEICLTPDFTFIRDSLE